MRKPTKKVSHVQYFILSTIMIVLLVILSLFRLKMLKLHSMCFIVGVVIAAIINSIIIMIIDL